MRKWLSILLVVFPCATVIAHGAYDLAVTEHLNVDMGNHEASLRDRSTSQAPHLMAAPERDLLFCRVSIASDAKGCVMSRDISGSDLDLRYADRDCMGAVYVARGGGPLEEEKLREDEERAGREEDGEENGEEEGEEEEGGGWDRLWDPPKLG